jgi:phosphinothricin acetyltransferase
MGCIEPGFNPPRLPRSGRGIDLRGCHARGRGIGKELLQALAQESEVNGIWTLQAGIFPENTASISLHKSCGFRKVGVRRRIGKLCDVWRDVILMERRSAMVGK